MRRRAHELMWPGKLYVPPAAPPAIPQRKLSLPSESNRLQPRGVQQYMSQRFKPVTASPPQLVRANVNYQPVRQNVLPPPKPVGSPLEYKYNPSPQLVKANVNYQPVRQNVLPPKPVGSPLEHKYNPSLPSGNQARFDPKPYVSPFAKPPYSPLDKKPLSPYAQVKPSASPVEKKFPVQLSQQKGGGAIAKQNVLPVERKLFNFPSSSANDVKPRPFALNKK